MINNIKQEIIAWNNRFPLDRWWRKKYDVSYLSSNHRESTFYQQYYEYHEDLMFKELAKEEESEQKDTYKPMSDCWWRNKVSSSEEIDDWFNTPI